MPGNAGRAIEKRDREGKETKAGLILEPVPELSSVPRELLVEVRNKPES